MTTQQLEAAIRSDLCFSSTWEEDGSAFTYALELEGADTHTELSLFDDTPIPLGQFALLRQIDGSEFEAVRDPIGIGKLFYTEDRDGQIYFARRFTSLMRHGSRIYAVPKGMRVRIGSGGIRMRLPSAGSEFGVGNGCGKIMPEVSGNDPIGKPFREKLKRRLKRAFGLIREIEDQGWQVFIALSGGLDSSIIAFGATQYLKNPIACTLDLGNSEDAEKASKISKAIGISHLTFSTTEDETIEWLDAAPYLCQDYRDFNVHCAALNLLLGKNIKKWIEARGQSEKNILLTGDLMNEYTCDYAEENVEGKVYYRLPRVGAKALQRHLIGGIESSDRELLPFRSFGISCIQPYAALFDLYDQLPDRILERPDVKKEINSHLVPSEVLDMIPKSKIRAQVGNPTNKGILGLCHHRRIDERHFIEKLLKNTGGTRENVPIFMGRYETEAFS
jgi:hypothetical protein